VRMGEKHWEGSGGRGGSFLESEGGRLTGGTFFKGSGELLLLGDEHELGVLQEQVTRGRGTGGRREGGHEREWKGERGQEEGR